MKHYIGETIDDYTVVDFIDGNVIIRCKICGHERKMPTGSFRRQRHKHSYRICGTKFFETSPINGDYEFIGMSDKVYRGESFCLMRCMKCGNVKEILPYQVHKKSLYHNKTICGINAKNEEIGRQYGDIKIISYIGKRNNSDIHLCECQVCHRTKIMQIWNVKNGKGITHKSCSSSVKDEKYIKEFRSRWANMRDRTTNPNNEKYHCYGGRGITSDEFEYFIDFYDSLYESFIKHVEKHGVNNTTLERIDVNKGYTSDNCTWATWKEQSNNKQDTVYFKVVHQDGSEDIEYGVSNYEKEHGMSHNLIFNRLYGIVKTNELNGDRYYLIGNNRDREEGSIN